MTICEDGIRRNPMEESRQIDAGPDEPNSSRPACGEGKLVDIL